LPSPAPPGLIFPVPDPLTLRLKTLIITTLKLDDVRPEDIPDDEPLIGSPRLGLDSVDALELVLALEREFGVKIGSSEESRKALANVSTLAAYLRANSMAKN
jgi:acyl carrier protein